jgi:hypothetical protein
MPAISPTSATATSPAPQVQPLLATAGASTGAGLVTSTTSSGAAPTAPVPGAAAPVPAPAAAPLALAATGAGATTSTAAVGGAGAGSSNTVVGHIVSANNSQVVMKESNGTTVTLPIRPQDVSKVNPSHLQSVHTKPGAPDINMPTQTINGVTYAVGPYSHAK